MTRPCNAVNMARFINALEVGGYEQGTGALNRGGKYCCLGVACAAAIDGGVELETDVISEGACFCGTDHGSRNDEQRTVYDGETGFLPRRVADWLGLEDAEGDSPYFLEGDTNRSNPVLAGRRATAWNDDLKASFPAIAQLFRYEFLEAA